MFSINTTLFVNYEKQGCIWQLLTMGQKAAKLPNYCILHWRLNALNKVGYSFLYTFAQCKVRRQNTP
jgi:hypothetical protein